MKFFLPLLFFLSFFYGCGYSLLTGGSGETSQVFYFEVWVVDENHNHQSCTPLFNNQNQRFQLSFNFDTQVQHSVSLDYNCGQKTTRLKETISSGSSRWFQYSITGTTPSERKILVYYGTLNSGEEFSYGKINSCYTPSGVIDNHYCARQILYF